MLLDRLAERAALGQLVDAARGGRSGALVVHGEAGVGKTALLEDVTASAAGMRIARVAGIESEMELAYAALQQLCAQMLDGLDRLPDPQLRRSAWCSGCGRGRRRTGFWWGWRR
jgi:predicted ATPase